MVKQAANSTGWSSAPEETVAQYLLHFGSLSLADIVLIRMLFTVSSPEQRPDDHERGQHRDTDGRPPYSDPPGRLVIVHDRTGRGMLEDGRVGDREGYMVESVPDHSLRSGAVKVVHVVEGIPDQPAVGTRTDAHLHEFVRAIVHMITSY